jgi:hypothetical protein
MSGPDGSLRLDAQECMEGTLAWVVRAVSTIGRSAQTHQRRKLLSNGSNSRMQRLTMVGGAPPSSTITYLSNYLRISALSILANGGSRLPHACRCRWSFEAALQVITITNGGARRAQKFSRNSCKPGINPSLDPTAVEGQYLTPQVSSRPHSLS